VTDMQQRNSEHVNETDLWDSLMKGNADW